MNGLIFALSGSFAGQNNGRAQQIGRNRINTQNSQIVIFKKADHAGQHVIIAFTKHLPQFVLMTQSRKSRHQQGRIGAADMTSQYNPGGIKLPQSGNQIAWMQHVDQLGAGLRPHLLTCKTTQGEKAGLIALTQAGLIDFERKITPACNDRQTATNGGSTVRHHDGNRVACRRCDCRLAG